MVIYFPSLMKSSQGGEGKSTESFHPIPTGTTTSVSTCSKQLPSLELCFQAFQAMCSNKVRKDFFKKNK